MDLNPLVTPNDVLTNCLNGTLVTFNGNENVLQNDMGNGRVETAYLPEGYVPMGTAELGGIIYIVSYNPLTDKCQIGSFPSPERNITSDEITIPEKSISNNSFQDTWGTHHKKISSSIVKLTLLDDNYKLYPGDKYTIYTNNLWGNIDCISDCQKEAENYFGCHPRNVTIHVVSLGDDGKITYLDSSQKWNYNETKDKKTAKYYIKNTAAKTKEDIKKDLDNYRSLVTTAYNIFNSKVSGELALLFEVEIIDSFELTWDADVQDIQSSQYDKQATIKFNSNWSSSNPSINPKYLVLSESNGSDKLKIPDGCKKECYIEYNIGDRKNDGESDPDVETEVATFQYNSASLTDYIWNYGAVPAMQYGILPQYEIKGSINFSEIGSGKIDLIQWKYYIEDNDFYIKLGVDAYPEKNKKIYYIDIKFIPINEIHKDLFKEIEEAGEKGELKDIYTDYYYRIENKNSYSGYFQELLQLSSTSNGLERNKLYVADIVFKYGSDNDIKYKHHFRFLYTAKIFNDLYLSERDFKTINLYDKIADYIKIQSTCTEKIDSTLKIGQFYPNIPSELKEDTVHYGCQYAIVNPNKQNNLTVTNKIEFYKYSELFNFRQQTNDIITVTLSKPENSISNTATVSSDSVNNVSDDILPIISEEWKDQTPDKWTDTSGKDFKTAVNTFNFSDQKTGNECSFAIYGYYFNKINALYATKDINAQNIIKSVLSNETDLTNFGYNKDLSIVNWHSIASGENNGGGGWTLTYYPNKEDWNSSVHAEDCYDDQNEMSNWWDYLSNDPGNVWNNLQNARNSNNFPIIKWHKRDDGWIHDDSANRDIHGYWAIWALTDGGHIVPLRSLYNNPGDAASAVLNFLVQLYYVDTTGYNYKGIRVNIINYLSGFIETWKLNITSTVKIENPNNSIYIGSNSLANIQEKIDTNYLTINNINANGMKTPEATIINFQHSFKSSSLDLQEMFQNDKKTTVGSLLFNNWTGSSEETGIKNANNLYIIPSGESNLYEANPINVKKYMRKGCTIKIDENSVKLSGGSIANVSTQIMNYMSYYDGKMHFKESGLAGEPVIRFADTDGEGDSSYWKITNNTPHKFPIE